MGSLRCLIALPFVRCAPAYASWSHCKLLALQTKTNLRKWIGHISMSCLLLCRWRKQAERLLAGTFGSSGHNQRLRCLSGTRVLQCCKQSWCGDTWCPRFGASRGILLETMSSFATTLFQRVLNLRIIPLLWLGLDEHVQYIAIFTSKMLLWFFHSRLFKANTGSRLERLQQTASDLTGERMRLSLDSQSCASQANGEETCSTVITPPHTNYRVGFRCARF